MKTTRQFGAILLLLIWSLIPAMACKLPSTQMTAQERACCRQMKMGCGNMEMPPAHGCCHKDVQADHAPALSANIAIVQPPVMTVAFELPVLSPVLSSRQPFAGLNSFDSSPPHTLPSAISILRI